MRSARFARVKAILIEAAALPADARDDFVADACRDDPELLAEVRDLLRFDRPGPGDEGFEIAPEGLLAAGASIGPYEILAVLGEGGMGTVYLARERPATRRHVALKVIKPGMDSREVIARFEAECQVLALMDHPGIARVFTAGSTPQGLPYFVMEYVPGEPITAFCDEHRLGLDARLELFVKTCRAVEHAHLKGVIHRDIKPGNILVSRRDGPPAPKIIDFGIARALSPTGDGDTRHTQLGQTIGTPAYMSPEQDSAAGLDVDTRSDIYSLGVVLYELLTGVLPHDLPAAAGGDPGRPPPRAERAADRPSTRITRLGAGAAAEAGRRGMTVGDWTRRLRGDLDWITMKALDGDRERRYRSAADLADDVLRHLRHEPVQAGPPDLRYRLAKLVRRHRVPVAAGLLVLTTLFLGILGTTVGMLRARSAEAVSRAEARKATASLLLSLGREASARDPTAGVAYGLASLELDDRFATRRFLIQQAARGPLRFELPLLGTRNPWAIDVSPDGRWIAVGWTRNGDIWLYPTTGEEPRALVGHDPCLIAYLEFGPGSDLLASGGMDHTVRLWSVASGQLLRTFACTETPRPFLPLDGRRLVYCVPDTQQAPMWFTCELPDGPATPLGRLGAVGNIEMILPPSLDAPGTRVAHQRGRDVFINPLTDLRPQAARHVGAHDRPVDGVFFHPASDLVASVDLAGEVRVWDSGSGSPRMVRSFQVPNADASRVVELVFDPASRRFATSQNDSLVRIWDPDALPSAAPLPLRGQSYWVNLVAFHPAGDWLVSTGNGGSIAAWPLARSRYPTVLNGPGLVGPSFAIRADGRQLASCDGDGVLRVHDLIAGDGLTDPVVVPVAGTTSRGALAAWFLGSSDTLFVQSYDTAVCCAIDLDGGEQLDLVGLPGMSDLGAAAISPSGRRTAVVFHRLDGSVVKVWDLDAETTATFADSSGSRVDCIRFLAEDELVWAAAGTITSARVGRRSTRVLATGIDGRVLHLMADGQRCLVWNEPLLSVVGLDGTIAFSCTIPDIDLRCSALDAAEAVAALGFRSSDIYLVPLDGSSPHLLAGADRPRRLAFDPLGRFLAAGSRLEIWLWPLPPDVPPLDASTTEVLAHFASLTNLRVRADGSSPSGFTIQTDEFPGWAASRGESR